MLSRKSLRKYKPGDKVTAADKNFMLQEAKSILVGGRGIDVSNIAGKVNISLRSRQTIRRTPLLGNVFKLDALDGRIRWGFDTGDTATCVAVSSGFVYAGGVRNSNWGNGGTTASVWKLSAGGSLLWSCDTTGNVYDIQSNENYVYVTDGASLIKIDADTGEVISSVAVDVAIQNTSQPTFHSIGLNSTQLWVQSIGGSVNAFDLNLSSTYSHVGPLTEFCDWCMGVSASDDYVVFGIQQDVRTPVFGGAATISIIIADTTPTVLYTRPPAGIAASPATNGYGNSDIEGDFIATAYFKDPSSSGGYGSYATLIDGTTGSNEWFITFGSGFGGVEFESPNGYRSDISVDISSGLVFYSCPASTRFWDGSDHGADHIRDLFALDIVTGDVVWHWRSKGQKTTGGTGNDPNGITSNCVDRDGYVYVTTIEAVLPEMKIGDL